jgi:hypothetical protein
MVFGGWNLWKVVRISRGHEGKPYKVAYWLYYKRKMDLN